ncbi:MAG: recombinase [Limnospira sp. PMC 1291.21]|uniref:Recombinase n=2 Tax=Limnospira fusiformis PMC 851.14 TaxID=2219512 RepID=A0ABU9ELI8_LIMFS|nr:MULTISPECIES: recombinase [unclassified Limnospira]MDT9180752.1 recombinase [Limnospira sp. PMC 1238.20]MDT9196073.1 recombinase [Limnospira sp. PMC 1245.20]MDT9201153.1 recombinase [Limnospira sp. PMC 1042.18]MDT9206333.1 recombinase [Limnospira sp. PMC 1243.20]MDT9211487.1 recombinase [Limnospira sp. PMC 1252.20]
MSASTNSTHSGTYQGFEDILEFFNLSRKQCPKGVRIKRNRGTIQLDITTDPETGGRKQRGCNCQFTSEGIRKAVDKAWLVHKSLDGQFQSVSEWLDWYKATILDESKVPMENDLITYRQVFKEMEDDYFNGVHKNTKRKRSRDIASDQSSFKRCFLDVFDKVTDWDAYVTWEGIKEALYSPLQDGSSPIGSKTFRDRYYRLRQVAERAGCKKALEKMEKINPTQTVFAESQSVDLDTLLNLLDNERNTDYRSVLKNQARDGWCWVSAMCALYGLRPSEIAAVQNLNKAVKIDGITFPAISDPNNLELVLVIGEFTYFGASTKTGQRLAVPMSKDKTLINRLGIHNVCLPITESKNPDSFNNNHRLWLNRHNWGITQTYAFRHLANQLGEMNGIPQEIRARSFGHSVAINDSKYKKRRNLATELGILTRHQKQPLPLEMGKQILINIGINPDLPEVKAIIRALYQLDD